MQNTIKKPWEGIVLSGIYGVFSVIVPLITGFMIYVYIEAYILAQNPTIAAKMLGMFPLLYGVSFVFMAIFLLLAIGTFVGKRWVIMIVLVLSLINSASLIINIIKKMFNHGYTSFFIESFYFIGILMVVFSVWLAVKCLKHPFYGGNGKITLDTFKFWRKQAPRRDEMTTF
jgi:hypothetical protein